MARPSSKIMSIAEKKAATAGLKTAIKQHSAEVKLLLSVQKEADADLAAAKKAADVMVADASKFLATVSKEAAKHVAVATKAHLAVSSKTVRAQAAAAKGTDKLANQLSALEGADAPAAKAVPVVQAVPTKAAKKTAKTRELETA